jgi:hypothetical protein
VPTADEIVEVAVEHLARAPHAIIAYDTTLLCTPDALRGRAATETQS